MNLPVSHPSLGGISILDCEYLKPDFAAAFLMREGDRALFVETNTAHAVPRLLRALEAQGLTPEQVEYLIVTHVHLDHAGGASALMEACPRAVLLAHPRAVPHLIDPSRLVASARQVYGDEAFAKLYGEIHPIPAERVRMMEDGEEVRFGERTLRFFHTRGHANHHFCVFDSKSEGVFTGDSFGLAYPALQGSGLFIFPSTSPTDFDPTEAKRTLEKILGTGAKRAFLTHFGEVTDLPEAARQLKTHLDFSEALFQKGIQSDLTVDLLTLEFETALRTRFEEVLQERGIDRSAQTWDLLKLDLELNAAGIAFAAQKQRAKQRAQ